MQQVSRHELEQLSRSLVMGNGSLPGNQIERLIATCAALHEQQAASEQRLREVSSELNALRPVIAELRARLGAMSRAIGSEPEQR